MTACMMTMMTNIPGQHDSLYDDNDDKSECGDVDVTREFAVGQIPITLFPGIPSRHLQEAQCPGVHVPLSHRLEAGTQICYRGHLVE